MNSSGTPEISVIIATRNRADSLRRLLPRLLEQSPGLAWELVVVHNGSTDDTAEVLAGMAGKLRTVVEPLPGKSRALNRAMAAARGELLVFTDDDVEPDRAWLDEIAAAARRHPEVDCFGGRINIDATHVPGWVLRSRLRQLLTRGAPLRGIALDVARFPGGNAYLGLPRGDYPWSEGRLRKTNVTVIPLRRGYDRTTPGTDARGEVERA